MSGLHTTSDTELRLTITIDGGSIERLAHAVALALRMGVPVHVVNEDAEEERLGMLVNVRQVSSLLNVSRSTVYALRGRGEFPKEVRVGNTVRWRLADIMEWLESQ